MTLLDTLLDPPPQPSHKRRAMAITAVVLAAVLAVALWFTFRYYPEKKAAEHFFDALVADQTDQAYSLWKPTSSYRKDDFLADWGSSGYYGPVKSYKIMGAKQPKNSDSVAVTIDISRFSPMPSEADPNSAKTKTVTLWITPADKSFSFPP